MINYNKLLGTEVNGSRIGVVAIGTIMRIEGTHLFVLIDTVEHDVSDPEIYAGNLHRLNIKYFRKSDRDNLKIGNKTIHLYNTVIFEPIEYRIIKNKMIFRPYSK